MYQKEYIEFFCSRPDMEILAEVLRQFHSVTSMAGDRAWQYTVGNLSTFNVVTWGVFPAKVWHDPMLLSLSQHIGIVHCCAISAPLSVRPVGLARRKRLC